ncbi:hypothetical protein P3T37_001321 [Kitasatospora sp. MAA4]|uniref:hypothetical protein n=1 Tax=Kitasatospora sp. MAA4 TaxID=3035093 RepID=UPI00247316BD|nr:hypothetical protein [Kitasatospora sp. MAA4]MDH6131947.1 hypothetical protein [Kitasatospora sp. MAA4]
MTTTTEPEWTVGNAARDTRRDRIGQIQEIVHFISGKYAWMRPIGGGKEWTAPLACLAPLDPDGDDAA